jgi:hypothetical protein
MIAEKSEEWGEEVWVASLDMEKAFDKVLHDSVFACLAEASVDSDILHALWQIYTKQLAYVKLDGDVKSEVFAVLRGVRQGDPLSPILFNNVTRHIFADLKQSWARRGFGVAVGSTDAGAQRMTHAMFADDTTLFAASRKQLTKMIAEVKAALEHHGLKLNMDKCVVQTNQRDAATKPIAADGEEIPMVDPSVGFKVLGTTFTLAGRTSVELRSRIGAAWAKFHKLRPLLLKRNGDLQKRLKLFDACVGQTALWCCESWLLTKEERRALTSAQNSMLRRIAGPRRYADQPWIEWIKHATRVARKHSQSAGIRMWAEASLRAKWQWAGHVARMDESRLAKRTSEWRDSEWWRTEQELPQALISRRPRRGKWFRWENDLRQYAEYSSWDSWKKVAQDRVLWESKTDAFLKHAMK